MIRISVSGSPRSGKTSLVNVLADHLASTGTMVLSVPDLPRVILECLGTDLIEEDVTAFQHYAGFAQLLAEENTSECDVVVLDRSLIDVVGYWDVLIGGARPSWAQRLSPHRYDLVVLCDGEDIGDAGMDDPVRAPYARLREALGNQIRRVAQTNNGGELVVHGDVDTRLATVLSALA